MNLDHRRSEGLRTLARIANSGGPSSRTRKERIRSTLLGTGDGAIRCPRIVRVGITFPNGDPVELLTGMLEEEGYGSPEDLRDGLAIPDRRLIAQPYEERAGVVHASYDARRDILWNALVLGLCTAQVYDPARPVLWTEASLTRRLELFDPAGFYA
jgi:hypothetical protein